jgi:hypothetical protein
MTQLNVLPVTYLVTIRVLSLLMLSFYSLLIVSLFSIVLLMNHVTRAPVLVYKRANDSG